MLLRPMALMGLAACAAGTRGAGIATGSAPDAAALRRDVAWLADDAREGRGTGTPGGDSAAAWLARRHRALGLQPIVRPATCTPAADRAACAPGFLQPFTARLTFRGAPADAAHDPGGRAVKAMPTQNVVAMIPGSDPVLRHQYVVIGAHYDHLGRMPDFSRDPEARDAIRNGADDNASGTAVILELARLLARRPVARSVVIVHFGAEELGLFGSQWFVEHAPMPLDSVQVMLNFDMVGRLRDDKLMVYGTATASELPAAVTGANVAPAFRLTAIGDGFGPSDHSSFFAKDVPVLHFFTDLHDQYHRADDDLSLIDAAGMARVAAYAERIVRDVGDRPARLTFQRAAQPTTAMGTRSTGGVYFGSVPDMSAEGPGMRISGVRAGSPADKAGLRAGDVIVEFAGVAVTDLYTYTDALGTRKPGDTVPVVVLRDGRRVTLTATLAARGQ
jgi:hypothetical protein